jgi:hypothetical protein
MLAPHLIITLLVYPAIFWIILYMIVGQQSTPPFRSLFLVLFFTGIIAFIFQSVLGIISIVTNFLLYTGSISLIFKLEFKQVLKTVAIFTGINLLFELLKIGAGI